MQKDKFKSALHFHFVVIIFGFTAILGALISIDAMSLVWYRMGLASVVLGVYLAIRKVSFKLTKKHTVIMIMGGVLIALHWITFFHAVKLSNVSITLSIFASGAFFTSFLEPFFYRRKIIIYEVILGLLVIMGLAIALQTELDFKKGIIYAFLSIILSVFFTLINGKYIKQLDARVMSFYQLFIGWGLVSVLLGLSQQFNSSFFQLIPYDILWLTILAVVCTSYAFVVSIDVMRFLSPYSVMLGINMEPVYGICLAYFIFGAEEHMPFQFYLGTIIILVAVLLNGYFKLKSDKEIYSAT